MRKAIFVICSILSCFQIAMMGQSVKIVPKTITYTRPHPTSVFKKTFTVTYPQIIGKNSQHSKKIEDSISYQKVLLFQLKDEMGEYQWLEEAEYQVGYNKNGVLSIYLSFTGTSAHTTFFGKNVVVNLKTGNRVGTKDVFTNLDGLIKKVTQIQKEEIAASIEELKNQSDFGEINTYELFRYVNFEKIHLEDFSVDQNGITFHYSYGFPYILRVLEPSGNYFMDWKSLKPHIKRGGLLGKFIH